jgi:hypothetical protein
MSKECALFKKLDMCPACRLRKDQVRSDAVVVAIPKIVDRQPRSASSLVFPSECLTR